MRSGRQDIPHFSRLARMGDTFAHSRALTGAHAGIPGGHGRDIGGSFRGTTGTGAIPDPPDSARSSVHHGRHEEQDFPVVGDPVRTSLTQPPIIRLWRRAQW